MNIEYIEQSKLLEAQNDGFRYRQYRLLNEEDYQWTNKNGRTLP
jgi:hypothetical protein